MQCNKCKYFNVYIYSWIKFSKRENLKHLWPFKVNVRPCCLFDWSGGGLGANLAARLARFERVRLRQTAGEEQVKERKARRDWGPDLLKVWACKKNGRNGLFWDLSKSGQKRVKSVRRSLGGLRFTIGLIREYCVIIGKAASAWNVTVVKYGPFQQSHNIQAIDLIQHRR